MVDNALSSFNLDVLRRHDELCIAFERDWQTGKRPRLEDYLARESEGRPVLVRELLLVELEYRRRARETPVAEDYVSRLPEYEDVVAHVLRNVDAEDGVNGRFRVVEQIAAGGLGQVTRPLPEAGTNRYAVRMATAVPCTTVARCYHSASRTTSHRPSIRTPGARFRRGLRSRCGW